MSTKINVSLDLDWLDDEYSINLEEEVKNTIISAIQSKISVKVQDEIEKQVLAGIEKTVDATIGEYLKNIMADKLADIQIPIKEGGWSSKVEYISLTEYVGQQYQKYLTEKTLDKNGHVAQYNSDKAFSVLTFFLDKHLHKMYEQHALATIQAAHKNTMDYVMETLQSTVERELNADLVKRIDFSKIISEIENGLKGSADTKA